MQSVVRHSLATAAAAESLARIHHPALASEAFIAGLLHNLGIVIQNAVDATGIEAMITLRNADDRRDMRTLEAERATVGHEACVGVLFEAWQLPESLIAAAQHHHDPMAAQESHRPLAALVHLGSQLALATGTTFNLEKFPLARCAPAMSCLELDDDHLDAVAADLPARVATLGGALL
jgi:HD-like signal output (HDOD) protein